MTAGLVEVLIANSVVALFLGGVAWCVNARDRHPGVAHSLYLLALLKMVTPPLWTVSAVTLPAAPAPAAPLLERVVLPVHAALPSPVASPVPSQRVPWATEDVLLWLWIAGSAGVLVVMARRAAAFRAAVRSTGPAPEAWQREARALLPVVGLVELPALDVTRADVSPLVYPTWRGLRVLLPQPLLERLTPEQRQSLILHELAHVRRRDPWVRLVEVAIVAGLWWHPLVWWLRAGLRDAEEKCCDAWVTAGWPAGRRAYADAVLAVAEGVGDAGLSLPAHATGAVRLRSWKKRLRFIMTDDTHPRMGWRAKFCVLAVAATALPLLPTVAQQGPERPPEATTAAKLELLQSLETKQVRVRLARGAVDDWVESLSGAIGLELEVTEAARKVAADKTHLGDVDLPEMSARKALDVIATVLEVRWVVSGDNRVVIDAPAPAVQVIGEVLRPGWIELCGKDTVIELVSRVGTTEDANIERLILIRQSADRPLPIEIDFRHMVTTGDTTKNLSLQAGDILVVPARPGATGRRARTKPEHLTTGDAVVFFLEPSLIEQPGFELLKVLTERQVVGPDGTILIPYVGHVPVVGLTETELEDLVSQKLQELYKIKVALHALYSIGPLPPQPATTSLGRQPK